MLEIVGTKRLGSIVWRPSSYRSANPSWRWQSSRLIAEGSPELPSAASRRPWLSFHSHWHSRACGNECATSWHVRKTDGHGHDVRRDFGLQLATKSVICTSADVCVGLRA
ncbi:MAG TPA: hypothetical protein DDZ51_07965 [Planctomycetaceae bacterium]|nr:hypothetical protein [Planctomycetaceae bacterium]